MFIRVQWPQFPTKPYNGHHTFECREYYTNWFEDPASGCTDCSPCSYLHLILDSGKHELRLSKGTEVYVMNNEGKTIDRISV